MNWTTIIAIILALLGGLALGPLIVGRGVSFSEHEVKNPSTTTKELRPYGLCAGEFVVPENFDDPLPADVIDLFEGK